MATSEDKTKEYSPLMHAIAGGDSSGAIQLINDGADVAYQESVSGASALMLAAGAGDGEVVSELLMAGAPWNALDRKGHCAGDYALLAGHQPIVDALVNAGVQAELLFKALSKKSALSKKANGGANANTNANASAGAGAGSDGSGSGAGDPYLRSEVEYQGDNLVDEADRGVMMMWEKPLMERHAAELCASKGSVLNIGFGLGLIDTAIQSHSPAHHTIIEAHPTVHEKMLEMGFGDMPNVTIAFGRWQDVLPTLGSFDAIYFDTFSDVADLDEFHEVMPNHLNPGGLYSFFNGVCPHSLFFQGVACETIKLAMEEYGLVTEFEPIDLDVDESEWAGISNRYFTSSTYYLPRIVKPLPLAADAE